MTRDENIPSKFDGNNWNDVTWASSVNFGIIVEGTQKSVYSETFLQRKSFLADTSLQQTLFCGTDEMMLKLS